MAEPETSPALSLASGAHKRKKAAWIGLGTIGLLMALLLVAPAFIDLGLFKRSYLPRVEEALNRRVDVSEVRLSFLPAPSIRLSKLKISDSPAFADNLIFSADQVQLRLKLWPLLHKRFEITELILEKPVFNLLKQADGTFNYSDIAGKKPAAPRRDAKKKPDGAKSAETAVVPLLLPARIRVRDGELNLASKGQAPIKIKGIELSLHEFTSDRPFPYRAALDYPGLRTISLEGQLDYQEDKALLTLKDSRLKILDLTLPVEGTVGNLSTLPQIKLNIDGNDLDAKPVYQILSVFGLAPRDTEMAGPMALAISVSGPPNGLVNEIKGVFKNVKVQAKRSLKGTLSGQATLSLPFGGGSLTQRLQGQGKLVVRDGELTNVDLIKKIQRVTGMIGLTKDERREVTTFKSLETDFILGGGYAEFTRLHLVNPQMEISGDGTMTLDRPVLEMAISTVLSPQVSARAGRARATSYFKDNQGRIVVPLKVTGPVENPSVNLNTEKLADQSLPRAKEKNFGAFFKQLFRNR